MFFNGLLYNKKIKKSFIVLVFQILFLIFSLLLVLWGQKKLKRNNLPSLERKAQFIVPDKE
ncbi:MAG: hypothetical protein OXJ52_02285 [Oligoflexia bacterium]|nr:hypothetical protein [Oligoflexia bacterium]